MKDHGNGREFLFFGIVRESPGNFSERFFGNEGRAAFPALIGMLVHITVITGEVASTVDLENELLQLHGVRIVPTGVACSANLLIGQGG